ncbi:hypothetical protein ACFY1P_34470 [Streptomyces sp. NPDC001407]|uniref:hypothetical protein n=1 Tax=Streptomyces sp. NPDC001407 TaxID=3364573 RepID=UPI0036C80E55
MRTPRRPAARLRSPVVLLCALLATCAFLPPAAHPPEVTRVRADAALDGAFAGYAERNHSPRHWTGGDSTYSVPVPEGELWVFSDTFLGTVRPDGSRSPLTGRGATPFVHNSFVLWNGTGPHTLTGRDAAGAPASVVSGPGPGDWYWSRAGLPGRGGVQVVYAHYARTGPGPLDIAWRGNALGRFGPGGGPAPRSLTPLPSSAGIAWGAWLSREGGHTYVYGTEKAPGLGNHLHLARVTGSDLRGPWQFWTGRGTWSPDEHRSARLSGPDGAALRTSDELSVVRHGAWYALCTQRADRPFSAEVQLAWSRTPNGPFTRPRTVFTAPEAGAGGTYRDRNVFAYNPHEHPELERPDELVVSYNVNSLVPDDVIRRADIYRPRFLRMTFGHARPAAPAGTSRSRAAGWSAPRPRAKSRRRPW